MTGSRSAKSGLRQQKLSFAPKKSNQQDARNTVDHEKSLSLTQHASAFTPPPTVRKQSSVLSDNIKEDGVKNADSGVVESEKSCVSNSSCTNVTAANKRERSAGVPSDPTVTPQKLQPRKRQKRIADDSDDNDLDLDFSREDEDAEVREKIPPELIRERRQRSGDRLNKQDEDLESSPIAKLKNQVRPAELLPFPSDREAMIEKLRQFDLNTRYGNNVGMSRLERWNRAEKLGLKPPEDVREILLAHQSIRDDQEILQPLWHEML